MLTKKQIKDTITVIRSLEKRRMLLNGTTRKMTSQEGGFLSFLKSLMSVGFTIIEKWTHTIS